MTPLHIRRRLPCQVTPAPSWLYTSRSGFATFNAARCCADDQYLCLCGSLQTAQVGGLVGLVYGPVKYMRKDKAAGRPLLSYSIPRMCLRGTIYGGTLGIALVVARSAFLQADEVVDRGFRVYHNKQQALSDVFVAGGGFAGGFFGLAALRSSGSGALFNAARGSALGMVAGIGTYAAARYLIAPTHDLWKP